MMGRANASGVECEKGEKEMSGEACTPASKISDLPSDDGFCLFSSEFPPRAPPYCPSLTCLEQLLPVLPGRQVSKVRQEGDTGLGARLGLRQVCSHIVSELQSLCSSCMHACMGMLALVPGSACA